MQRLITVAGLALVVIASACAPLPSGRESGQAGAPQTPAAPKKLVAAIMSSPQAIERRLLGNKQIQGTEGVDGLYNPAIAGRAPNGQLVGVTAESVPSVENGLWQISPDGKMTTTWKLRAGVTWHDGTPFTSQDLELSYQIDTDRELPFIIVPANYARIEKVEAPDALTFVISWKTPDITADTTFAGTKPLPRHKIEDTYRADKSSLESLGYFDAPIGTGPFRIREWVRDSHIIMDAYDRYFLGRPRIDTIEIRMVPDQNTFLANLAAGGIDVSLGKSVTLEQALSIQDRWQGRIDTAPAPPLLMFPQLLTPNPKAVGDARFRKGLTYAIDRQTLADSFLAGRTSVVIGNLAPDDPPEFQAKKDQVVMYPYDPRRAMQTFQDMGLAKGADGMFLDIDGGAMSVEIRTITSDISNKTMLAVADYWKTSGVTASTFVIPPNLATDAQYRFTYGGLELVRNGADRNQFARWISANNTPLPENGFRGTNRSRYINPEFDAQITRYQTTIPLGDRLQIYGDLLHFMTDQQLLIGLFYDVEADLVGRRLQNFQIPQNYEAWAAVGWDLID